MNFSNVSIRLYRIVKAVGVVLGLLFLYDNYYKIKNVNVTHFH